MPDNKHTYMSLTHTQIQSIKQTIEQIIKEKPECRENKRKLLANFIFFECKKAGITSLNDYLKNYSLAQTVDVESVLRIHRVVVAELDKAEGKIHDTKEGEQSKVKNDLKSI